MAQRPEFHTASCLKKCFERSELALINSDLSYRIVSQTAGRMHRTVLHGACKEHARSVEHSALTELYEKEKTTIIPSSGRLRYFKEVLKFYF